MTAGIDHYDQSDLWGEDQVFQPAHQILRLDAIDELLPTSVTTVLDVGAGDGRVLHHLAERRPGLVSVAAEPATAALVHARAHRVQCSGDALPFRDRAADAVLSCEVLEHLPPDVFTSTVAELARVSRRYVLVTVPNQERRSAGDVVCPVCRCRFHRERHLRSFHPRDLPDLVPGLELVRFVEAGPRQPIYPRAARQALERIGLLVPPGAPTCPQCGTRYTGRARPATASSPGSAPAGPGSEAPRAGPPAGADAREGRAPRDPTAPLPRPDRGRTPPSGRATPLYSRIRELAPKARHPYWLLALYRHR